MIINDFILTAESAEEFAKEYINAWHKKKTRKFDIFATFVTVMFFIAILQYILTGRGEDEEYLLIIMAIEIILYVIFVCRRKILCKKNIKKIRHMMSDKNKGFRTEFDESIKIVGDKNTEEIPYEEISDYLSTKNYLVLIQEKGKIIPLKKDSFQNGDYESFKEFYEKKSCVQIN